MGAWRSTILLIVWVCENNIISTEGSQIDDFVVRNWSTHVPYSLQQLRFFEWLKFNRVRHVVGKIYACDIWNLQRAGKNRSQRLEFFLSFIKFLFKSTIQVFSNSVFRFEFIQVSANLVFQSFDSLFPTNCLNFRVVSFNNFEFLEIVLIFWALLSQLF